MFNSPEGIFVFVFSIAAAVVATNLWNIVGNEKADQLGKVGQQQK
ncbi:hypothetical protein [Psychrobacillus sp.]|nr:hypothetical protein [Psychrobacillus sp.]